MIRDTFVSIVVALLCTMPFFLVLLVIKIASA